MELKVAALLIGAMAFATATSRLIPVFLFADRKLSSGFKSFLHYAPIGIIAAMIAPDLLLRGGHLSLAPANAGLWIGAVCFAVALKTRNIAWTVLVGVLLKALFSSP